MSSGIGAAELAIIMVFALLLFVSGRLPAIFEGIDLDRFRGGGPDAPA